ncbi:hypothetical protein SRHO_G00263330 [Serrasalmus rhombeus]
MGNFSTPPLVPSLTLSLSLSLSLAYSLSPLRSRAWTQRLSARAARTGAEQQRQSLNGMNGNRARAVGHRSPRLITESCVRPVWRGKNTTWEI